MARLRHSYCPKHYPYHSNVPIQEAKSFSTMTGVGSADMCSGMRCTLNPVHRELTKAPFGNAVGAKLGQVRQVRVGLRFVKPTWRHA